MKTGETVPQTIEEYIATFPPKVRVVLKKIRAVARRAAPGAQEVISYRMPALKLNGILVYFAAFESHIGLFPPVRGDAALMKAIAPYAGEKGNLRFPLDQPIPYDLIERITRLRVEQDFAKATDKRKKAPARRTR